MSILIDKQKSYSYAENETGKVVLVGAGPGDPELITLKGLRALRKADVVVYDRLVGPELLDEAPARALKVFVGKEAGRCSLKQEEINALLISYARQGHFVVRLKGGDPFVFGRGGEEVLALAAEGIPCEVIPGISSAMAVPASAGIPVTQRGLASSVTIVTGHERQDGDGQEVDWEQLARLGGTLVILMGVESLPRICQRLLAGGLAPATPAAVVQQGTLPDQRVVTAPLARLASRVHEAGIKAPAVIVIGAVAALADILNPLLSGMPLQTSPDMSC